MQVAQIYQSIEFSRLTSLVPFVDAFQLERAIVDAARHCDLQVCAVGDTDMEGLGGLTTPVLVSQLLVQWHHFKAS